jgi:hypothetical protein
MDDLARALMLVLVIEGAMPFLSPKGFRANLLRMASLEDRQLRIFGALALLGALLLSQAI